MNRLDSNVTTDGDGNVFVSVDLPVCLADEIIALLRANETPTLSAAIDTMAKTLTDAYGAVMEDTLGCPELLPGADPATLTEPAVLESSDGLTLAVLMPGALNSVIAATGALAVVHDYAVDRGVDMNDPNLSVSVHAPSWMVLHTCGDNTHAFHPQDGNAADPGAVLVTRVDLELDYAGVPA